MKHFYLEFIFPLSSFLLPLPMPPSIFPPPASFSFLLLVCLLLVGHLWSCLQEATSSTAAISPFGNDDWRSFTGTLSSSPISNIRISGRSSPWCPGTFLTEGKIFRVTSSEPVISVLTQVNLCQNYWLIENSVMFIFEVNKTSLRGTRCPGVFILS